MKSWVFSLSFCPRVYHPVELLAGLLIWDRPFLARLNGPSSGSLHRPLVARLAAKQMSIALLGCYITAHGPSMACLLNAAQAIFGLPGIFKWLLITRCLFHSFWYFAIWIRLFKSIHTNLQHHLLLVPRLCTSLSQHWAFAAVSSSL